MHRRGRPLSTADRSVGPLLAVKYAVPPVPETVLPRPRLESRLNTASKLTVVAAPAGWGKTSLLSRWAGAADVPVAWVSLDGSDDEPVRFWSYVLAALRRVNDDIGPAAVDALQAGDGPIALALPLLLNELAASSTRHVLVLDDYHVVTHAGVHDGMEFLVAHLPPTLRVVVACRWDPPLPLARMRVRGELTEVRVDDLRFSDDESVALLNAVATSDVDPRAAAAVHGRAEGWPAGLRLAALALRDGHTSPRGERHLFDYLTDEVLPALSPAQRDLLVRAAPLELLSGSLCDAALDVRGSAAVLAELERAALFVVALDRDGEWYRCHQLLRDALGWSPGAEPDDATRAVLRRAAGWFSEHGRIDDAVRSLQDARDDEAAAGLLVGHYAWFLDRGWAATYLTLGERLRESAVSPGLALYLTYAAEVTGDRDRVVHWLDVCDRHIDADTVVDGWRSPRAAEQSLRGLLATSPSEPEVAVALCERALALETAAGTEQHPVALMALGLTCGFAGRFDDAARLLTDSWRLRGRGLWSTGVDLQVAGQLGLFLLTLGADDELDRLLVEASAAADVAERDWGEAAAAPVVALIRLVDGRRAHRRGEQATAPITRGLHLADVAGRALYTVIGLLFLADAELGSGDRPAARAALVRARDVVETEPVAPFLRTWLDDAEARIGRAAARAAVGVLHEQLTDRELSILRLLPGPATQREIGATLYLSINTVKAYNKSIHRKLGVGSRRDAVRVARELGLI